MARWGILGCGGIASKFASSLKAVHDGELVAVASNTPGKAEHFAVANGAPAHYQGYEDLLAREDIDAVYVATTHNFHHAHVLAALRAGKAVLCEKPLAVNAAQSREMAATARAEQCFLMEGMWTRFLPSVVKLRELLAEGLIGEIRKVHASFGFQCDAPPEGRMFNPALAGGCLLDMGIYPLSFISMVLGKPPNGSHQSLVKMGATGVDVDAAIQFDYGDGVTAHAWVSLLTTLRNEAYVVGEKGTLRLPPWFLGSACLEVETAQGQRRLEFPYPREEGFRWEIEEVHRCLRKGLLESEIMPLAETISLHETMDSLRADWGLRYPFE